jgi:hypothetical protein
LAGGFEVAPEGAVDAFGVVDDLDDAAPPDDAVVSGVKLAAACWIITLTAVHICRSSSTAC